MRPFGRGGVSMVDPQGPAFAPVTRSAQGNNVPGYTGPGGLPARPGPHPDTQKMGGQVGWVAGNPHDPEIHASPRVVTGGAEWDRQNYSGITGFNDQLTYHDRHAYWSRGSQRVGNTPSVPGNPPNPVTQGPATPSLRTINVTVNPQIGSDNTANQDDLSRPYTWLGQQDGTVQDIYGGVPGLYIPYGSRGGVPFPVVDPTNGQGGPETVYSGPPHGLHSDTYPAYKKTLDRYATTPQMVPGRIDRPDNSRIAGQSFSQTIQPQGSTWSGANAAGRGNWGLNFRLGGSLNA